MIKEEMKNRISMALKDPILQQGFECICKENADFEKAYNETEELLDKQIEATYKLFEENKELKEKAKEIVTALLNVFVYDLADDEMDSGDIDVKVKAEQFLNSLRN